ncbi:MAG: nucleoside:proton symporter [Desulfarculus sp.]|nr:nucleoside:proton symporter [Desulfarculus sp.]
MSRSMLGYLALLFMAWLCSSNRRRVPWRIVAAGTLLQLAIALAMFKISFFRGFFLALNQAALALEEATLAGTSFVFGYLGGGPLPFGEPSPGAAYVFAFRALPMIIVVGGLAALLYHWRVIPVVVRGFSFVLRKTMGIGGALGVGASATIFLGVLEGPLVIRPYLSILTKSEMFSLMTCGLACIAGTVLVVYAGLLREVIPDSLGHILTASIIHAPAALVVAAIMVPEEKEPTMGDQLPPSPASGSMDAVTRGTSDGLHLFLAVVAMIVSLLALVKLCNIVMAWFPDLAGAPLSLERMFGWVMAPVVWLMGVPWAEAHIAGQLMGTKTMLNEFIAYIQMSKLPAEALSPNSDLIMTYAMCGFANFGSLGILLGGLASLVPERRGELASLGLRAMLGGTLASCLTGAIVGMIY